VKPELLPANQFPRFYKGGAAIAEFRDQPFLDDHTPEDWVGSTTCAFGTDALGLSRFADGRTVRDANSADPEGFLGPAHAASYGSDPALLVKLLDAGERLPVHCHPDRAFARRHLECPYGKTEAWVIIGTRAADAVVHLGFRRDVDPVTLASWVSTQRPAEMLDAMHSVPVRDGDTVLVPAGMPHAIGEGVLIVELQEPTDLSVLLEWDGFDIDGARDGHLGIGFDAALQCVDRTGYGDEVIERLRSGQKRQDLRPGVQPLFPVEADQFFRAQRITTAAAGGRVELEAAFSIVVCVAGSGALCTEAGEAVGVRRGQTVLVPWAAGPVCVEGEVDLLRCLPPAPVCA
jgi:mannose-6-phosphate isomerase